MVDEDDELMRKGERAVPLCGRCRDAKEVILSPKVTVNGNRSDIVANDGCVESDC